MTPRGGPGFHGRDRPSVEYGGGTSSGGERCACWQRQMNRRVLSASRVPRIQTTCHRLPVRAFHPAPFLAQTCLPVAAGLRP